MYKPRTEFHTEKGTVLPIIQLKGKEYLEVKYRIVWFREVHPSWSIETSFVAISDKHAIAKAQIKDETGRVVSTSHKYEDKIGFPDYIEKAETGSVGRALALIGFGTQFCADDLDEGKRIVDSPANNVAPIAPTKGTQAGMWMEEELNETPQAPKPSISVKIAANKEAVGTPFKGFVTEKQLKRLFAISKQSNWSNEDVKEFMSRQFRKERSADLIRTEYDAICDYIQDNPKLITEGTPEWAQNFDNQNQTSFPTV